MWLVRMLGVAPYDEEIVEEVADVFDDEQLGRLADLGVGSSGVRGLAQHARNAGMDGEDVVAAATTKSAATR